MNNAVSTVNQRKSRVQPEQQGERVVVYIRLRPFLKRELENPQKKDIMFFDTEKNQIQSWLSRFCLLNLIVNKNYEHRQFSFDYLLGPKISQKSVYDIVARPVVDSIMKGFNGTILAYGQTGTGKTYTMVGKLETPKAGLMSRSLDDIFYRLNQDDRYSYSVKLAYLQIYKENIQDLIDPLGGNLKLRECPERGVFVEDLTWVEVSNTFECMKILQMSEENRKYGSTKQNIYSSRSHTVLKIKIEKRFNYSQEELEQLRQTSQSELFNKALVVSTLYLVDLAGSERVKKSLASGERLNETKHINSSLSTLGKCIHKLTSDKPTFVPFRDSKLTRLLQNSLGGNSKTSMVITIGPSEEDLEQTSSSLLFGQRAMRIENKPVINKQADLYALNFKFKLELEAKEEEIEYLEKQKDQMTDHIMTLEKENLQLKNLVQNINPQKVENVQNVQRVEQQYKTLIKKMENEHRTFLEDIDKLMVEQEKDIDNLKKENTALKKLGKSIKKEKKQLEKQIAAERNQLRTQLSKLGIVQNESSENWEQTLTSFKKYFHRWVKERMNLEKLIEQQNQEIQLLYNERGKNSKKHERQRIAELLQIKLEIEAIKNQRIKEQKEFKNKLIKIQKDTSQTLKAKEQTIQELTEQLNTSQAAYVQLQLQMNNELKESEDDIKEFQSQIQEINQEINEKDKLLKENELLVKDFELKILQHEEEAQKKEKALSQMQTVLQQYEEDSKIQGDQALSNYNELEQQMRGQQEQNQQLLTQNFELEKQLQEKEFQLDEITKQMQMEEEKRADELETQRQLVVDMEKELSETKMCESELEKEKILKIQQLKDYAEQIQEYEQQVEKLEERLKARNIEITQISETQATQTDQFLQTIHQLETQNQSHIEDLKSLKEEREVSHNEIKTLTKESQMLKSKLESTSSGNDEKDDEIRILSTQIQQSHDRSQMDKQNQSIEIQRFEVSLSDKEKDIQELQKKIGQLVRDNQESLELMENEKIEFLENLKQEKETHKHELKAIQREIQSLTKSNIFLKDSLKHTEEELFNIENQNLSMEQEKSQLKAEIEEKKRLLKSQAQEIVENNKDQLEEEIVEKNMKIMKLKQKIDEIYSELDAKNQREKELVNKNSKLMKDLNNLLQPQVDSKQRKQSMVPKKEDLSLQNWLQCCIEQPCQINDKENFANRKLKSQKRPALVQMLNKLQNLKPPSQTQKVIPYKQFSKQKNTSLATKKRQKPQHDQNFTKIFHSKLQINGLHMSPTKLNSKHQYIPQNQMKQFDQIFKFNSKVLKKLKQRNQNRKKTLCNKERNITTRLIFKKEPKVEEKEDKKEEKEEKEVKSLVEDLVFLVEVQTKISSDVDLQPHIIKLSNIYQKQSSRNQSGQSLYNSIISRQSQQQQEEEEEPEKYIQNISTLKLPFVWSIFSDKFNKKVKQINVRLSKIPNINITTNKIQNVLNAQRNLPNFSKTVQEQIMVNLTQALVQYFNYGNYLQVKCQKLEILHTQTMNLFQHVLNLMTRKEIELALRKKDKKLMSEEFDTKFNKVISDRKTLYLLSEQYKYEQTRDKAAITIQRYFRRKKESKITNLAQMAKKKFQYMAQNYDQISTNFQDLNANTGRHLMKCSYQFYDKLFCNVLSRFAYAKRFENPTQK